MCERARAYRPEMEFGADIIAGFPTETEEMFQNSLKIVEECDLTYLHVFPYSEREGTPAAKIPNQVPMPERKERAKRLRDLGEVQHEKLLKRHVGREANVIVEKNGFGRTESFVPVRLDFEAEAGALVSVQLSEIQEKTLLAKAA